KAVYPARSEYLNFQGRLCWHQAEEGVMPAITVDDILVLPRVPEPGLAETERTVTSVTTAPSGYEGEGFPVRRAFAGVDLPRLDPFVHMDQMGEVDYGPGEPKGTAWHPHRGFETVTYIIDGTFQHQDSNGGGGLITNGDTQWMTAGGGILHIEAPPEDLVVSGGLFHGFQLWVNLPARLKMTPPRYQDIRAGQVALLSSADGGALLRVIAGSFGGHDGPGITHTPISLVHATVSAGAQVRLPWRKDFNSLAYVLAGSGTAGAEKRPIRMGQLAVFGAGDAITFAAGPKGDMDVLLLGGEPIREPVTTFSRRSRTRLRCARRPGTRRSPRPGRRSPARRAPRARTRTGRDVRRTPYTARRPAHLRRGRPGCRWRTSRRTAPWSGRRSRRPRRGPGTYRTAGWIPARAR